MPNETLRRLTELKQEIDDVRARLDGMGAAHEAMVYMLIEVAERARLVEMDDVVEILHIDPVRDAPADLADHYRNQAIERFIAAFIRSRTGNPFEPEPT